MLKTTITEAEIERAQTPAGGWTRKQLAGWGVPWPPPRGWKEKILRDGTPYSKIIETVGGGNIVAENRPLFCKHCDGKLISVYEQLNNAYAPVKELVTVLERRCGKIVEAVWPNGRREWQCGRCGRKVASDSGIKRRG